jgi:hypothetical protein
MNQEPPRTPPRPNGPPRNVPLAPGRPPRINRRLNFPFPPVPQLVLPEIFREQAMVIPNRTATNVVRIPRGSVNIITQDPITEERPVLNFRDDVDGSQYESAYGRYYQDEDSTIKYVRDNRSNPYTRRRVTNAAMKRVELYDPDEEAAAPAENQTSIGKKRPRNNANANRNSNNLAPAPPAKRGGSRRHRRRSSSTRRRRPTRRHNRRA